MQTTLTVYWGKLFTSWTFWANAILVALGTIDLIQQGNLFPTVPAQYWIFAIGFLNLILRLKTNDALVVRVPTETTVFPGGKTSV